MSFIRPEVEGLLMRWRESLVGLAAVALGLFWVLTALGPVYLLGWVLVIGGALLAWAGVQRARFRLGAGGPGLVQVVEGQLAYFGPHDGGVVSIKDISRLDLAPGERGTGRWIITRGDGTSLAIPVNAEGAEALFDVFAALPGLATEEMLAQLTDSPNAPVAVWQKVPPRLH
ncbi:MAG: hypothetical protein KJN93_00655 [Alphaproteobacteria bacterium]|nr:hypothetical protein [Alphaproteobacteria bacterium]NNF23837.1 hypothetical protein [Paracoccaceae bacterium]